MTAPIDRLMQERVQTIGLQRSTPKRRARGPVGAILVCGVFAAGSALAQGPTFSIDFQGPTIGVPDSFGAWTTVDLPP